MYYKEGRIQMSNSLKILMLDIETSPTLANMWGMYQELTSYDFIVKDWRILCWAGKFLGDKKIHSSALVDFPKEYQKNPENDRLILEKLWKLMDEADIICGHNINDFDIKKINARFIQNGFKAPSPYRTIDTLKICRSSFAFTSNKLNDVSQMLGLGQKVDTGGFKLWRDCIKGDMKAWHKMVKYCKNDIVLLEKVYMKLRPFMSQHPHMNIESPRPCCPKCASSAIQFRGYSLTSTGKFRRFQCQNSACGGWGAMRVNELPKGSNKNITKNA